MIVPVRVVIGETEGLSDISVVADGEMAGGGVIVRGKNGVRLGGGVRDSVGVMLAVGGKIYPAISRGIRQAVEIVAKRTNRIAIRERFTPVPWVFPSARVPPP